MCSASMFVIFLDIPNDDRLRNISLGYKFHDASYTSISGWSSDDEFETISCVVSRVNIFQVLANQYYKGYPVRLDVGSWHLSESVDIGAHTAIVTNGTMWREYDCWICEIDEETSVYYDRETGLLIHSRYSTSGTQGTDFWMVVEEITLTGVDYAGLYAVEIRQTGVILAAVFVELAAITWLIAYRLQKKNE